MPRFLISGATGFIGHHLVRALIEQDGAERITTLVHTSDRRQEGDYLEEQTRAGVRAIACDLLKLPRMDVPVPDFDVLYHLAAHAETEDARGPFHVNSDGTRNLLTWLGGSLKGKRVIYTGTLASIDRDRAVGPATEETPCTPKTPYGKTKLEAEKIVNSMSRTHGFDYTTLRLCTIIGRGFRKGGMFGVFPRMLANGSIAARLKWPGRASFLSMADLVQILLKLPQVRETRNQMYVLSNGEEPTFDQFLDQMAQIFSAERKRIALPAPIWRMIRQMAWCVASIPVTPHALRNGCWRMSHLISDGLLADSSKLNRILSIKYQPVVDALRDAYGKK